MGDQPLYKVDITVEEQGYGEADTWSHFFGFRHIDSYIDPATNGRYTLYSLVACKIIFYLWIVLLVIIGCQLNASTDFT
jgi:hypothetical protein